MSTGVNALTGTLARYLAARVATTIVAVIAGSLLLVFVIDFVELLRRAGDASNASIATIANLSLHRVPAIVERVLPFAVLFGALGAFVMLSRRLELVIARASGVSAWQFLTPAVAVAALVGVVATAAFNPIAAHMQDRAERMESRLFANAGSTSTQARWIRQRSMDGQAIIRASSASSSGVTLNGVTVFSFTPDGEFRERIEARTARLVADAWDLDEARVIAVGREPQVLPRYRLATNLSAAQVRETLGAKTMVGFWDLPDAIALAGRAGLSPLRHQLQLQELLARPALLIAMVLIAATVALRFFRFGGVARTILGGVAAGFVLYVVTEFADDLGAAGLMHPVAAAWLPAIVGCLMSVTVLLNQEDG
ncbi:LPS export ABC transporter permease LptG [Methylopila henanensis]|uniref:LPS export ABC transporter permease LptG n=1 Tax=Methylopila henanensis TaxID=873516 RepID=A0ABW4K3R5_9HYPH